MTNLPFLTQIFLQMVENNDLSFFPPSILTNLGLLWKLPVNGQKCGMWGLVGLAWPTWVVVDRKKPGPNHAVAGEGWGSTMDRSRCGLGQLDSGPSPALHWEPPQRSHIVSLSLSFLLKSSGDNSNLCLPELWQRENIKLSNTILCNWWRFAFDAPDDWPLCLSLL